MCAAETQSGGHTFQQEQAETGNVVCCHDSAEWVGGVGGIPLPWRLQCVG